MQLYFAPVQGHTDSAYRYFHKETYGCDDIYYTPFIRLEKDTIRTKDINDLTSSLNENIHLIPQIIFRDQKELNRLIELIKGQGFKEMDLNMGCPFPLQTSHGRGAATIRNEELAKALKEAVSANPDITFSVKMRLGMSDHEEWKLVLPLLNEINLSHITLHPRVAKQQYSGEVDLRQFEAFLKESKNKVVYNGDIQTPEDIKRIETTYPAISGIMSGRGILGRPSLFCEYSENRIWEKEKRIEKMLEFHNVLFNYYKRVLCGDAQILSKIKPFWEYAENEIGRKAWKAIKKSTNMAKYETAVAMI